MLTAWPLLKALMHGPFTVYSKSLSLSLPQTHLPQQQNFRERQRQHYLLSPIFIPLQIPLCLSIRIQHETQRQRQSMQPGYCNWPLLQVVSLHQVFAAFGTAPTWPVRMKHLGDRPPAWPQGQQPAQRMLGNNFGEGREGRERGQGGHAKSTHLY